MGKVFTLTKEQKIILYQIKQVKFLTERFYFTGGTALSLLYLGHRESEDLDFFTEEPFDIQAIITLFNQWSKKYKFEVKVDNVGFVYFFNLIFMNGTVLKVDFGQYPYKRLEKREKFQGISVDSLTDIAVNKLFTVIERTNVKDFVDLYFLLNKFTVWDLIEGVKIKFGIGIEPFILASDFLKVDQFENMPKMIKPLSLDTLKIFFREKAKSLGKMYTK